MGVPDVPIQAFTENHMKVEQQPEPETKEKATGNGLIRADDITDAADSDDLLSILLDHNLDTIEQKSRKQHGRMRANEEKNKLTRSIYNKAEAAYKKQWNQCYQMEGHGFTTADVKGYSVLVCDICGMASNPHSSPMSNGLRNYEYDNCQNKVDEMNKALIQSLAKKMMEVDEEAGLLEYPKPEEFEDEELVVGERKTYKYEWKFSHWKWYFIPWFKEVRVNV